MILYCWWKGLLVDFEIYTYVNSLNFETLSHQYMQKENSRGPSIHAWHAHKGVETIDRKKNKQRKWSKKTLRKHDTQKYEFLKEQLKGSEMCEKLWGWDWQCFAGWSWFVWEPPTKSRCSTTVCNSWNDITTFFFTSAFLRFIWSNPSCKEKHVKLQFGSIHFLAHLGWDLDHYLSAKIPPSPFFGRSLLLRFSTIPSDKLT